MVYSWALNGGWVLVAWMMGLLGGGWWLWMVGGVVCSLGCCGGWLFSSSTKKW